MVHNQFFQTVKPVLVVVVVVLLLLLCSLGAAAASGTVVGGRTEVIQNPASNVVRGGLKESPKLSEWKEDDVSLLVCTIRTSTFISTTVHACMHACFAFSLTRIFAVVIPVLIRYVRAPTYVPTVHSSVWGFDLTTERYVATERQ